jgi:hypothetical protein
VQIAASIASKEITPLWTTDLSIFAATETIRKTGTQTCRSTGEGVGV